MRHASRQGAGMKSFQLGLIVAIALLGVWFSTLWAMAQSVPPDVPVSPTSVVAEESAEASAIEQGALLITPTVGTTAGACATTTSVQVVANTTVYYCYTVHNRSGQALSFHNLQSSRGSVNRNLNTFTLANEERRVFSTTIELGDNDLSLADSTSVDVTNYVTWTARPTQDSGTPIVASGSAFIDVVNPAINVVKTVGQDRTVCGAARSLRVPSGQAVSFCISIQNTGDITFTSHTLNDTQLSIVNATFNYTLTPGSTLTILPTNLSTILSGGSGTLERSNVTAAFVNSVSHTSRTASGLTASGVSTATVDIGTTTVRMTKTVSTRENDCGGSNTIQVQPGTEVYYCVIIENTGQVTLSNHRLTEQYLSIDVSFEYDLEPGARMFVNNEFLASNNLPIVFGPFEVHPRYGNPINNTMNYAGGSSDGFSVTATAASSATYPPTPTVTATSRPRSTSTPIPVPTNSPTITPIQPTPTPTFTPTWTPETPTATPTLSYAISLLETPTPRTQAAGIPGAPVDPSQQVPTPDPNQPQPPQPQPPQPQSPLPGDGLPVQDPFFATATQISVDATATEISVQATVSQASLESAQATAMAQAQATLPAAPMPESPLATPTPMLLDTPTALPVDVTVLPPVVTAEVGPILVTATPGVMVIIVTSTPLPGEEALPEGQRPIIYPTPTPTADFLMAAARTFDVAVATLGWVWFLVGSLIFFVTTGIVAGLFFRQADTNRFELPEPDYQLEEEPKPNSSYAPYGPSQRGASMPDAPPRGGTRRGAPRDDEWPADLP